MRCCIHLSSSVTSLMAGLSSPFFLMHLNASLVNAWISSLLPWLSTTSSTICNMQFSSIDKTKQSTKFIYPRNISTGWWPVRLPPIQPQSHKHHTFRWHVVCLDILGICIQWFHQWNYLEKSLLQVQLKPKNQNFIVWPSRNHPKYIWWFDIQIDYWPWPTIIHVTKSLGYLSGYSYKVKPWDPARNLIALTMEMIKEGAIGDELKNQHGNFSFRVATKVS